jgi:hypothetical protein
MARKKPTRKSSSRPASRTTSQKKTPARKAAKAKAAKTKAVKAAVKSSARKKLASKGRAPTPAKRARPKQRIAISHYRNEDFKADGLRAYAHYRDLGFADATSGLAQAHVIRLIEPCDPDEVSKLHYHDVEFQMIYVLKGWVKTYMEGQGETPDAARQRLDAAAEDQASDHGLFRRSRAAGSDSAGQIQDG